MKFYLAPMEGITGYIYRNAYDKYFNNIDRYFTPFIVANKSTKFKTRELRDVLPENNSVKNLIPQILTNNSEDFISTVERLKDLGYNEVNLNLGCPSGTVVSKKRGSGFLAYREELDKFLEDIYGIDDIKISIKTRIGKESPEEFYELLKIYNKYPVSELIVHPRTQKDFYGNTPDMEMFRHAMASSKAPLCYNGDIFTLDGYKRIEGQIGEDTNIMIGRGILANPSLIGEIKGEGILDKKLLKDFHDEIVTGYRGMMSGDRDVLFKMKELWGYMIYIFDDSKKYAKKIKKSQNLREYMISVDSLFNDREIIKGAGLFSQS